MAERGRKKQKKRDSTIHVKPPLDFIESPLNGRKYYCTPVQAARRPFLASSLPVDDKEALKWVSVRGRDIVIILGIFFPVYLKFRDWVICIT